MATPLSREGGLRKNGPSKGDEHKYFDDIQFIIIFSMVYAFDVMSKNSLPSPNPKEFFLCFL